jgi:hypothetical protein
VFASASPLSRNSVRDVAGRRADGEEFRMGKALYTSPGRNKAILLYLNL